MYRAKVLEVQSSVMPMYLAEFSPQADFTLCDAGEAIRRSKSLLTLAENP
jgi:hypothetical protein